MGWDTVRHDRTRLLARVLAFSPAPVGPVSESSPDKHLPASATQHLTRVRFHWRYVDHAQFLLFTLDYLIDSH
jgi:hypothetical protein